jgi:siroheme synthase-like protein
MGDDMTAGSVFPDPKLPTPSFSLPIALELHGRTVLVVGLGAVGHRKARALAKAGARVIGVDPAIERRNLLPSLIEVRCERYCASHLKGASLAFAAATAAVNRRVVADARRRRVWVCSASEPGAGDFTVPAIWREGPLTLTVATAGASPALAVALRDRAVQALGPAAVGLSTLLAELRGVVRARLTAPAARRRLFTDWADPRWLELWTDAGPGAVRHALVRTLDDAVKQQYTRPEADTDPTRACQKKRATLIMRLSRNQPELSRPVLSVKVCGRHRL